AARRRGRWRSGSERRTPGQSCPPRSRRCVASPRNLSPMTRRFIGVRWWLGAAFALVAAVSTAIVVAQFSSRSETALRANALTVAAGDAYLAAARIPRDATVTTRLPSIAQHFDLDLYVYRSDGRLVAKAPGRARFIAVPPVRAEARREALAGRRDAVTADNGGIVVVGVPFGDRSALVAVSRRPDVAAAVGILNDQALRAGVVAGVIGVLVGLLLAQLIALRLRRLATAAEAIAHGNFESPLSYRVRDEFGALAQSFDRMRRQLRRSFRHIEGERDRLRLLLERLHEGVVTVDQQLVVRFANAEAQRVLGRVREGDPLPEPWQGFSLRDFAGGLFDAGAELAQAHVRSEDEQ